MPLQTPPKDMPEDIQPSVAWLMQRASKVAMLGSMCFRFGPDSLDTELAEDLIAAGKVVPKTNMQAFCDSVVSLERSLYVFYSHMQGLHPEIAPPGLVERLTEAETALTEAAAGGKDAPANYFKWLREQRQTPAKEQDVPATDP